MKKFQKICIILVILFSVIGIGCMAAAFGMGVSIPKRFTRFTRFHGFRFGKEVKQEYRFDKQQIRSMEIDIGSGTLQVVKGTGNEIVLKNSDTDAGMYAEIKNDGTLSIKQSSKHVWFFSVDSGADAVLMLPQDVNFDELDIDVGSGDVKMEHGKAHETVVDCGSGMVEIHQLSTQKTVIDCGSGDVNMTFTGSKQDYNYEIDCGSGDVLIGTERFSGSEYENENHHGNGMIEIDCGSGDVTIDFLNQENIQEGQHE